VANSCTGDKSFAPALNKVIIDFDFLTTARPAISQSCIIWVWAVTVGFLRLPDNAPLQTHTIRGVAEGAYDGIAVSGRSQRSRHELDLYINVRLRSIISRRRKREQPGPYGPLPRNIDKFQAQRRKRTTTMMRGREEVE